MKRLSVVLLCTAFTAAAVYVFMTSTNGADLSAPLSATIAAPDSASAVPRSPLDTPGPNWVLKTDADKARLSTVGKPPSKYDDARCDFTGCPPDVPFIYYATPHRNRAFAYRRLLLTAQHDIEVSNVIPQACVCAVVADYDDTVLGPTAEYALDAWNSSCHHIRVRAPPDGGFDAAFARQVTVDAAVYTPRNQSIVFWLDTDMVVLPGLIRNILRYVWEGHTSFAPIVLSIPATMYHYRSPKNRLALFSNACLKVRGGGYGMVGVYVSDLDRVGGVPMKKAHVWGAEDRNMAFKIRQKTKQVRFSFPYLWHMDHPHAKVWGASPNGIAFDKALAAKPHDPSVPEQYERMPPGYWERSLKWGSVCHDVLGKAHGVPGPSTPLNDAFKFMQESPSFQRWSVNASTLLDAQALPTPAPDTPL